MAAEYSRAETYAPILPKGQFSTSITSNFANHDTMAPDGPHYSQWFYPGAVNPPKIGTRFSRESLKLLQQWFTNNMGYPYPSKEELKLLQHQTGLDKAQIRNWLANRRRGQKKGQALQNESALKSGIGQPTTPTEVLACPETLVVRVGHRREMDALERWVDSPPDIEPAYAADFASTLKVAGSSHSECLNIPSNFSYQMPDT